MPRPYLVSVQYTVSKLIFMNKEFLYTLDCVTNQCGFVSFIDDEETWSYLIYHNIIFVIFSAKQNNEVSKAIFAGNLFNLKM